jgi:hypothetical protein
VDDSGRKGADSVSDMNILQQQFWEENER